MGAMSLHEVSNATKSLRVVKNAASSFENLRVHAAHAVRVPRARSGDVGLEHGASGDLETARQSKEFRRVQHGQL